MKTKQIELLARVFSENLTRKVGAVAIEHLNAKRLDQVAIPASAATEAMGAALQTLRIRIADSAANRDAIAEAWRIARNSEFFAGKFERVTIGGNGGFISAARAQAMLDVTTRDGAESLASLRGNPYGMIGVDGGMLRYVPYKEKAKKVVDTAAQCH